MLSSSAFLPYPIGELSLSISCCCIVVFADSWNPTFSMSRVGVAECPSDAHSPQLPSGFPLTVKDLLLSGTLEHVSAVRPWAAWCQKTWMHVFWMHPSSPRKKKLLVSSLIQEPVLPGPRTYSSWPRGGIAQQLKLQGENSVQNLHTDRLNPNGDKKIKPTLLKLHLQAFKLLN